jgi:hypothetical protein
MAKLSRWTKKAVHPFRHCKDSTWVRRGPQSFSTLLICSSSTARIFEIYRSRNEKAQLAALFTKPPAALRYSISFTKDIDELLEKAKNLGLEGLIGKRSSSMYEVGKRSGASVKIKLHLEQEFETA